MKLIIVSNRIPVTIKKTENGFEYGRSSGGLVTGIESLAPNLDFIWIGSIGGLDISDDEKRQIKTDCWEKFHCVPVFLSRSLNDHYYDGFCNAILWPTLHSFPDDVCFTYDEYSAYKETNKRFADSIMEYCNPGDIVWVHDYHLMLVPKLLRKSVPDCKIMYFLHTTFPDPSNLNAIIYKNELLSGILSSDLVSFHIPDYMVNFINASKNLCLESKHKPMVKAIPIGIDPEMFRKELRSTKTMQRILELKYKFTGKKILLGVDRTDYIKGMPHKLKGFQEYLKKHPEKVDDVVMIQIGIPSRLSVTEYSNYVSKISELVTEINGSFGNVTSTPVRCLFKSVDFSELVALYAVSDALLVTSIIDGMNLVALEYVASQEINHGVVILSRFSGVSNLLHGQILHNPNNTEEISNAIETALEMSKEERERRYKLTIENVDKFTSMNWASENLNLICPEWYEKLDTKTTTSGNK